MKARNFCIFSTCSHQVGATNHDSFVSYRYHNRLRVLLYTINCKNYVHFCLFQQTFLNFSSSYNAKNEAALSQPHHTLFVPTIFQILTTKRAEFNRLAYPVSDSFQVACLIWFGKPLHQIKVAVFPKLDRSSVSLEIGFDNWIFVSFVAKFAQDNYHP